MGRMFDALQKLEREKTGKNIQKPLEPITPEYDVLDDKLVSFFAPSSLVTEQFRRLRTHIIKPNSPSPHKTIMVTSAMPSEGKSLISINLAVIIALELHSHALLVDCDLRNPSITRFFGLHEGKGLSNYLQGESELSDLFTKTAVDKLSIIPGGPVQENPVELIGSEKMKTLIKELKSRYADRYIIMDTSPILATTEPAVLNRMADGIIFVVRSGKTPRETIQQAVNLIDKDKIIGVVLNDVEFKTKNMIQKHFGARYHYYDYPYARHNPDPQPGSKAGMLFKDLKIFANRMKKPQDK